jgi:hypothetical protein
MFLRALQAVHIRLGDAFRAAQCAARAGTLAHPPGAARTAAAELEARLEKGGRAAAGVRVALGDCYAETEPAVAIDHFQAMQLYPCIFILFPY